MILPKKQTIALVAIVGLCVGVVLGSVWFRPDVSLGSVNVTAEYTATSTAGSTGYGATITGSQIIRSGAGTLGSVVITGANTGIVNIYNATTSNVSKRTGQPATSTILIASIPASAAAGTYTFDVTFSTGLYVDLISGVMPTTTITFR